MIGCPDTPSALDLQGLSSSAAIARPLNIDADATTKTEVFLMNLLRVGFDDSIILLNVEFRQPLDPLLNGWISKVELC